MASTPHYDLIVIGTGPGGEGAAMKASKHGKSVAAIERYTRVGGGCTHWGTIPSKALRRAIYHMNLINQSPIYKRMDIVPEYPFAELLATANNVIDQQVDLRESFYDRNGVRLIPGHARFLDPHTLEVESESGIRRRFTAEGFVIATGSRPYRPSDVDFSHPRIFDSDTLLRLDRSPRSITIFGAGVIGCEYASMLRNMQLAVNLVNTRERLLAFLDDEITDALGYHLSDTGIRILNHEDYDRVEASSDGVVLFLKSGKRIKSDVFLWANGRSGNTGDLGLETVGVKANSRGQIEINPNYQTSQPHIYAVGDVVGFPALASASYDQGRFAASHFCGDADYQLVREVPTGIYTTPEISSLGKSERQLTEEKIPYEVGKSTFKTLARAQIAGQQVGMLKLLFHRDTLGLLGIHCFGENAAEIIHIGQAIMAQPGEANSLMYFINTTFNYPTMAEAYRVAALNGLNRVR
jgi:NAD(P) transhydrogenase